MSEPQRIAIRGGTLVTMDPGRPRVEVGDLLVEGGRIAAVGEVPAGEEPGTVTIDAREMLVLPGFVNTHHHLYQTILRGVAPTSHLIAWIQECLGRYGPAIRPEEMRASVLLGLAEAIDSGVTTVADWSANMNGYAWAEAVIEPFLLAGMRGCIGFGIGSDRVLNLETAKRVKQGYFSGGPQGVGDTLSLWLAPSGPEGVGEDAFLREIDFARQEGMRIHIHLLESIYRVPLRPIPVLARVGALGPDLLAAHAVHLSPAEIMLFAEHQVRISHNPLSNMRLASGIMPLRQMLAAGLTVSLGLDGSASSDNNDFFAVMRCALGLQRAATLDASLEPYEILKMATVDGAVALGLEEKIGTLTPGKRADVVLVDTHQLHFAPVNDPVAQLVFCGQPRHVDTVIIDGRIRKRDKQLVGLDEERILAEAIQAARRVTG